MKRERRPAEENAPLFRSGDRAVVLGVLAESVSRSISVAAMGNLLPIGKGRSGLRPRTTTQPALATRSAYIRLTTYVRFSRTLAS